PPSHHAVGSSCKRSARPPCRRWPSRWRPSWRSCPTETVPPTSLVRACERLAPLTCGLHRKKRDCSGPPSRSPMKHAALPFRLRPGIAAFQLLGAALDRLVEAGVLPPERRPGVNAGEGSFLHADRQATEKKRPQV